jgi:hypothetical protein
MLVRCDRHRRPLEPVPGHVNQALVELLGGSREFTEVSAAAGRAFLDELRVGHHWLMCTCRVDGDAPMLFPCRRTDSGALFLRREVGAPHDASCPWAATDSTTSAAGDDDGVIAPLRAHRGTPFLLGRPGQPTTQPTTRAGGGRSTPHSKVPTVARVLFGLLERTGFDRLRPEDVASRPGHLPAAADAKTQYGRLHLLDDEPVGGGLTYRDLICTWPPALPEHLTRLRRLRNRFPSTTRPQGLFWGVVDALFVADNTTRVTCRYGPPTARHMVVVDLPVAVRMPGRCRRGPFWLLAALGSPGDDPQTPFQVLDAYAHPVYSRSLLLPVDSDAERRTAAVLLDRLVWWQRRGLRVLLIKPLETVDLPAGGVAPPPDFVLVTPSAAMVVIETVGALDDQLYIERKRRTHTLTRSIPGVIDVVEHDPGVRDHADLLRAAVDEIVRAPAAATTPPMLRSDGSYR